MNSFDDTPNKIPSLTAIRLKWGFRRFLYVAGVLLRSKHGPLYVGGLIAAFALLTFSAQSLYAAWNPAKPILAPLALPGEPRPATALHIPMPVLEKTLNLTSDEKSKIKTIHDAFHSAERAIAPSPHFGQSGEVDPAVNQAIRVKVADLETQSAAQMTATLTPAQAAQLPTLLTDIQNMEQVGLPPPAYPDLNLTADQKQRLAAVAETARTEMNTALTDAGKSGGFTTLRDNLERIQYTTHKDALAILTASQQQTVAANPPHPPKGPHPPRHPGGPRPPHGPEPPAPEPPTE